MEKQYFFFETGKGCLLALLLYLLAGIILVALFELLPQSVWWRGLLSLAVFSAVTQYVFAVDDKSRRNSSNKRNPRNSTNRDVL